MDNPWNEAGIAFPPAPKHELAQRVQAKLLPYQSLLECWGWQGNDEQLIAYLMLKVDHTTLRLMIDVDDINADVFCVYTAPEPQRLTWLLMQNAHCRWKARGTWRDEKQESFVVFLQALFPGTDLQRLDTIVWEALLESWRWRGQFTLWDQLPLN